MRDDVLKALCVQKVFYDCFSMSKVPVFLLLLLHL